MAEAAPDTAVRFPSHRYLRVEDLRRLRHLFFAARRPVDGRYAGRHASPQRGHAVEFSDYREYAPGDELGDVDWRVYGRSDRLFIKLFEHQTDMTVQLLVDASASMGYAGLDVGSPSRLTRLRRPARRPGAGLGAASRASKYDQACLLAGAIAFLAIKQQDRAAFGLARNGLDGHRAAQGSFAHLQGILGAMAGVRPEGRALLAAALDDLARRTGRKTLLVVLSDLMEDRDPILAELAGFTHRGHEVIVFHVLHADELALPDVGASVFVDSETDRRVIVDVEEIRVRYECSMRAMLDGWRAALGARGIDHNVVSTAVPYHKALETYLFRRGGRR